MSNDDQMKQPQSAPEIEYGVLGWALMDPYRVTVVCNRLNETDFAESKNRLVFKIIKSLYENDKKVDVISVEQQLKEQGHDGKVTGNDLLSMSQYSGSDIEEQIDILRDKATRRNLSQGMKQLHPKIFEVGISTGELVTELQRLQDGMIQEIEIPGLTPLQIYQRDQNRPKYDRLELGIPFFDNNFYRDAGSHKGTTEVIFGHTKHGKSRYAMWKTAQYLKQGYKGLYYIAEDTDSAVQDGIWKLMDAENRELAENLIIADKASGVNDLESVVNLIRYWNAKNNLDFVLVDYLQRIPVRGIQYHEEGSRIATCSNQITDLANQEAFFAMMLAQPHRIEKHRKGWSSEPEIQDLYGSSAIEKDAFIATSVFRPNMMESLRVCYPDGQLKTVRDTNENEVDKNSVFIRQKIIRKAQLYTSPFQFIDTNEGFKFPEQVQRERNENHNKPYVPTNGSPGDYEPDNEEKPF